MSQIELNADFKYVLETLEQTQESLFITGRAGTGKSTLLKLFRDTTKKKAVVLAPTGIAALNIGGQTLHSFFGLPARLITKEDLAIRRRNHYLYKKVDIIIIDEISMVRADMMDNIDFFLRINREDPRPFGGCQMVFFGDLFQLPPVISTQEELEMMHHNYDSPYFFSAQVFKEYPFMMVELYKVYRQDNRHFIRMLDRVRLNQIDYDDLEDLNERFISEDFDDDMYITLATTNAIVNELNKSKLRLLETPSLAFAATITGQVSNKVFPAPTILTLKEGAQVMFVRNDSQRRYVNGTIGKVIKLTPFEIQVEVVTMEGQIKYITVEQAEWEIIKYGLNTKGEIQGKVVGVYKQYPLRLAWAVTIHKSQGKTFDRIIINLGRGAFAAGQTYVALSRCTTLGGIVLKTPINPRDIMIDERIIDFYENAR